MTVDLEWERELHGLFSQKDPKRVLAELALLIMSKIEIPAKSHSEFALPEALKSPTKRLRGAVFAPCRRRLEGAEATLSVECQTAKQDRGASIAEVKARIITENKLQSSARYQHCSICRPILKL